MDGRPAQDDALEHDIAAQAADDLAAARVEAMMAALSSSEAVNEAEI